jgi:hypothetical protein
MLLCRQKFLLVGSFFRKNSRFAANFDPLFSTLLVYYSFNNYLLHSRFATNFSTVKEKKLCSTLGNGR